MIEKTVFTSESMKKLVQKQYNIKITKIEREERGSSNIFYIYDKENKYVLKEFLKECFPQKIEKEVKILSYLKNKNFNVPEYIRTSNNKDYFIYKRKFIVLMTYVDGYIKEPNTGNYEQTIESASYLGKLVKALEDFEQLKLENIDSWKGNEYLDSTKMNFKLLMYTLKNTELDRKIKSDLEYKIKLLDELRKVNLDGIDKITFKNCHGDFSIMQFLYKDEKINAILDFERARYMPVTWEIIRSYSHIDKKCKDGDFDIDNFIDYVKEVMKYVELNEYDLKYMPYIYLIRLTASQYGYGEYLENRNLKSMLDYAFWRTSICRSMEKRVEEISAKLLELKP